MSTVLTASLQAPETTIELSPPSSISDVDTKVHAVSEKAVAEDVPPLGEPIAEKRFWYQRTKGYDSRAIATLPSVFDDPETAKQYQPRADWENLHRFDPKARWTWGEEYKLIRKIDWKIMIWACVMFMALELDRANIAQALTDNFLKELHMNTNDYNLGNTVFKLSFLCAELPSQLVSKWIGPDRWIPAQMTLWSIVAAAQFKLSGRTSFLVCRALLGVIQGGFIPDIILYLSYFYKHHELSIRLGFFWTAMSLADVTASFLAYGLLHLRGVDGYSGWRWLFLVEGLLTLVVGLAAFVLMPAGPCQTANWSRGKKGWFTEREEVIMVNRVVREDPTKSSMHNRQPITPRLLWQSMKDYDLWPLYLIGLTFQIPTTPPTQYLTLSLRGLGFNTFQSNLLVIPSTVLYMILMMIVTYCGEVFQNLTALSAIAQIWAMPMLIYMNVVDITKVNKWIVYAVISLIVAHPSAHPIQVAWNSRNSYSVRSRTVSAAMYNMFVQAGGIVSSNVYRNSDKPRYAKGNRALLVTLFVNVVLYILTKLYYVWRNKSRDRKWNAMSYEEQLNYLNTTMDVGNKRLDFRFAH